MKKIISLCIALLMIFSFSACGNTGKSNLPKYVVTENNLTFETVEYKNEGDSINQNYVTISGLADEKIQESINAQIKENFEKAASWESYPAYRGMQVEMKKWEGIDPYSTYTTADTYANSCNILSVVIANEKSYNYDGDMEFRWLNIRDEQALNFDLNTGKLLKITDLFPKSVDIISYINDKINDQINNTSSDEENYIYEDGWNSFKVVGEFPGITEDQKFYLSNACDTLYLILDYDTPWVKTDSYTPHFFVVDISDLGNLQDRYVKKNIYTEESVNYIFQSNGFSDEDAVKDTSMSTFEDLGLPNVAFEKNISYYKSMADNQIAAIKDYLADQEVFIDNFVNDYVMPYKDDEGLSAWATVSSNVSRSGLYTNINLSTYCDASLSDENYNYEEIYRFGENRYLVYKDGVADPLTIEDLFVEGYDYTKLGIDENYSFMLSSDMIFFSFEDDFKSMKYSEIGCENLTIFK